MTTDLITQNLASLLDANEDISVAWLYGSRAARTSGPESDFDIAVAFRTFETSKLKSRLRPELLAIDLQTELGLPEGMISVVDVNTAPLNLLHSIFDQPIVLKNADNERLMREEIRASALWEDANA